MAAALSLVWAMPERGSGDVPDDGDLEKKGNGHSMPSTILVVEDEVLVRMAVADYLRHCGYRVLEAKTGEEAQAVIRAGELVEILFSDIDLGPGMNGFELAKWARENYRDMRIILTSGVARMTDVTRDLCDGPMITKPYSYGDLGVRIKGLLGALGRRSGG